ncbi:hypothetical protein [Cytophaga hutchinsonii]|uniref:Uncharacterized protein n=1 Tax=Cytophaga hutchinsonii (strain ATCC 33406 / DSM 1761 / CIP 103989 / NBRC 15051 / NCIMB 9469 / D465) TaxID=269798 RepID=A0A6N4SWS1_CYTH3|nr:hypothetical protein [Cytophaga hutchinsonii]ABG61000.1 hypothetical protein CHU_3767 [Cytophaga hutchinsonii ATCC 33406]SFX44106.1 hypothetical protein SAMN04487930_104117 [Cytophaga hutchinsonii ATCC 33406]
MIGFSAVADKIKLPYLILLIVVGIAIGFVPNDAGNRTESGYNLFNFSAAIII